MTEPLSSPPHCPDELARPPQYPVKLMQHQEEPAQLAEKINQIILNSSEPKTVLHQIAQVLGEAFRVDSCLIGTVTGDSSQPGTTAHWFSDKHPKVPPQNQTLSLGQLDLQVVQFACEPLTIDDVQTIESSLVNGCKHLPLPIQAVLTIATRFQGKNNGVISLIRTKPHYWSEREKEFLQAVAVTVAIALSQVTQTQLIASLKQQVHSCTLHKTLVNRLAMLSRSNLELNQLLQLAIADIAQTLQVDRGLILLLKYADPLWKTSSKQQVPKAKATVVGEWFSSYLLSQLDTSLPTKLDSLNQSFWLSECEICQGAFTDSAPVVVTDEQDLATVAPGGTIAPVFNITHLPALLLMPLESQGKLLGFLVLQQSSPRQWQQEELTLVEMICTQVSNAIIQTQTLRQVQSVVDERTAQLQRSLEVQAKLYEKTRQHIDQLRQLNQLKDEFIDTVSHELKTPLTTMSLAIRMLRTPEITPDRQVMYLDILEQECSREIKLIEDVLKLQELESHQAPLQLQTINLNSKIDNLAQCFRQKWADKELSLTLDLPQESLPLHTDVESFERILAELLTNAGKYSSSDTNVVLNANLEVNQKVNQIVVRLTNIGRAISAEDAKHIFDKFHRGKGVTKQAIQGTGLGLALVKCLVQHLNGAIAVSSNPVDNSNLSEICFTLTLPQFFDNSKPYCESD